MFRRMVLLGALVAAIGICVPSAEATPINGDFSVTMNYRPNCGDNLVDCAQLGVATGLDFIASLGGVATPGVPGVETITSASGDFAGLVAGLIGDFSFVSGSATANFPYPPIIGWEVFDGVTFDMTSVVNEFQNGTSLVLSGTGIFHMAGLDDTAGTFTLSANQAGTTFSASASKATNVPDPASSLLLLGMGLAGLTAFRRWRA